MYPDAGYGGRFSGWLLSDDPKPYNSFGNGSAMRVSSAAWLYNMLEDVEMYAALSAEVTHNHPEGIKGAQATAAAVFMARSGNTKEEIKAYIEEVYGYDLSRKCDEIRPSYHHVESCQETVPEAIAAFLEGADFEDVIRTAVSLGGDCDTLTAIAGSIAEAFYGIPPQLKYECYQRLDPELGKVLSDFELTYQFDEGTACKYHPIYWFGKDEDGFVKLERPFADPKIMNATMDRFSTSQQAMDGWRRANLYMKAFRVWDATMFGAWMGATLACGPFVDENGDYYPCQNMLPMNVWIGNVEIGVDKELAEGYRSQFIDDLWECRKCWARYLCGGGCQADRRMYKWDFPDDTPQHCVISLFEWEQTLKAFVKIKR